MKYSILILIIILISSCTYENKKITSEPFKINTPTTTLKDSIIEENLVKQLTEFMTAFIDGQADTAISYMYTGMFDYLKKEFPEEYSPELVKEMLCAPIKQLKKLNEEKDMTFEFEIGEITRRINYNDDKVFTIVVSIITRNGFDEVSMGDEIIAISNDNGINWKFMQLNKETSPQVLELEYPESIINKIIH
ncbi:hypothetical protein SAMN05444285_12349 [Draconibacterium orientale]|uniref:Uncharacterized protein n=1 Tax=Draconibacterium orientale TaxID=1168034 RepID=X5E681_9BACT|nr:hypothetical protein [Draconibacterium orientale]AHW62156.1 hypothetical protein FH5T_16255 [Draconibacterium orientale]SET78699.1 hypothetical protein SAMN05444285_12349 [Draconibacterium orientale]